MCQFHIPGLGFTRRAAAQRIKLNAAATPGSTKSKLRATALACHAACCQWCVTRQRSPCSSCLLRRATGGNTTGRPQARRPQTAPTTAVCLLPRQRGVPWRCQPVSRRLLQRKPAGSILRRLPQRVLWWWRRQALRAVPWELVPYLPSDNNHSGRGACGTQQPLPHLLLRKCGLCVEKRRQRGA